MSDAREVILGRIAAALADVPAAERPADVVVARDYRGADPGPADAEARAEIVLRFEQRVADYRAQVSRVRPEQVGATVSRACAQRGLTRIAIPPGLPAAWRPDGAELIEDRALSARELDGLDAAVTGCAAAIAETGTILLDGGEWSGRRVLTLVPDHHICIVESEQVAGQVPAAVAAVASAVVDRGLPITLISGPSASSDIELERVEGVHGPRNLLVVIADPGAP